MTPAFLQTCFRSCRLTSAIHNKFIHATRTQCGSYSLGDHLAGTDVTHKLGDALRAISPLFQQDNWCWLKDNKQFLIYNKTQKDKENNFPTSTQQWSKAFLKLPLLEQLVGTVVQTFALGCPCPWIGVLAPLPLIQLCSCALWETEAHGSSVGVPATHVWLWACCTHLGSMEDLLIFVSAFKLKTKKHTMPH